MTEKQDAQTYNEVAHNVLEGELNKRVDETCENCVCDDIYKYCQGCGKPHNFCVSCGKKFVAKNHSQHSSPSDSGREIKLGEHLTSTDKPSDNSKCNTSEPEGTQNHTRQECPYTGKKGYVEEEDCHCFCCGTHKGIKPAEKSLSDYYVNWNEGDVIPKSEIYYPEERVKEFIKDVLAIVKTDYVKKLKIEAIKQRAGGKLVK